MEARILCFRSYPLWSVLIFASARVYNSSYWFGRLCVCLFGCAGFCRGGCGVVLVLVEVVVVVRFVIGV